MVALLPIVISSKTGADKAWIDNYLQQRIIYFMDSKGYYLMPEVVAGFDGGIAAAMKLDDASLQALGGKDADLLLEVAIVDADTKLEWGLFGVSREGKALVRTTLLNKATRTVVFQKVAPGSQSSGGMNIFWDNTTAAGEAAFYGFQQAIDDLKVIQDASSF